MNPTKSGMTLRYLALIIFTVVVLAPFVSIVFAALQPPDAQIAGLSVPTEFTWSNFSEAWVDAGFSHLTRSSFIIVAIVVPTTAVLATLAGFSLGLLRPPGSKGISLAFVLGLTLPVELVVVALYFNLKPLGLTDSFLGIGLAEVALFLPFGVYWMQTHFTSVPRELVESGRIDGASDSRILGSLLLPISWPAITTLCVLVFMWAWNQFLLVLVMMQDPSKWTAPAGLGFFVGQYTTNIPLLSAASLIVIAPIVAMYLVFQRNLD